MQDGGTTEIEIRGDLTPFQRDMAQAKSIAMRDGSAIGSSIANTFNRAVGPSRALAMGVLGVGAAAGVAGLKAISLAGQMEQSEIAFTTMLGSAEKAEKFLDELFQFAAKTPFEFTGLQTASRQLLAFGFGAKEIVPMMTNIGDAVAALGGGEFEIQRVTRALGQMQAKGKVSAEEMMQLAELGIPAWKMLADGIGVSVPEAMERASAGTIRAAEGIPAILEGMGKQFEGSMDAQSSTLLGLWSTFKDNVTMTLTNVGQMIIDTFDLKGKLSGAIEFLQGFGDGVERFLSIFRDEGLAAAIDRVFGEGMTTKMKIFAGALVGALIPAVLSMAVAIGGAVLAIAPFMLIGAGLAALAILISKNWETIGPIVGGVVEWFKSTALPLIQGFVNAVVSKFEEIVSWFQRNWPAIKQAVANVLDFIKGLWQRFGDDVLRIVRSVWDYISSAIRAAMKIIQGIVETVLGILSGDWSKAWDGIKKILAGAWDAIVALVKGAVGVLRGVLGAAVDGIKALLGMAWDAIVAVAKAAWNKLVEAVKNIVGDLIGFVKSIPGRVVSGLGNLASLLIEAGKDIIRGLINGIKSMVTGAINAVKDAIGSIVQGAKNFLGIGSPSKVFKAIGQDIMRGLAIGIDAGTGMAERSIDRILNHLEKAGARIQESIGHQVERIKENLASALEDKKLTTRQRNALKNQAQVQIDALRQFGRAAQDLIGDFVRRGNQLAERVARLGDRISDFRDKVAGAFEFGFTGAFSDESTDTRGEQLLASLMKQQTQARQFALALRDLTSRGASQALLQHVLEAGQGEGLQIAKALLNDLSNEGQSLGLIGFANDALREIAELTERTSGSLARTLFGDEMERTRAQLHAFSNELSRANSILRGALGASTEATGDVIVNIDTLNTGNSQEQDEFFDRLRQVVRSGA